MKVAGWGLLVPEPEAFTDACVAADSIILVSEPHDNNDVEGGDCVVKKLGHYGLHSNKSKDYSEEGGGGECYHSVRLNHIQQINCVKEIRTIKQLMLR